MPLVRAEDRTSPEAEPVRPRVPAEASTVDLGTLFDAHAPMLVRVLTRMVGSSDRAEDIVQRAFLTAHRKGLPEGDIDRARAWLYRVAMNELRHERRSMARRLRLSREVAAQPDAEGPASAHNLLESATDAQAVREIIDQLPEAQREVFVLYEMEELTGAEIAAMLAVPENTVWSRLRLGRRRFEKLWLDRQEVPA